MEEKFVPHPHYATVDDLLKFIERNNIPLDASILMQRVTDWYFVEGSWKTHKKKGFHYHCAVRTNNDMQAEMWRRNAGHEPTISAEDPSKYIFSEENLNEMREEYYPAWSPVFYKDEPNVLFLDAHY